MQYYDIPKEDYLKYASLRGKEWNRFVDQHHRSTCTNCGKDYLYCGTESPILKDAVWDEVVGRLGLACFERESSERHRGFSARRMELASRIADSYIRRNGCSDRKRVKRAVGIAGHLSYFLLPVPDDCHCTLCVGCMELGLGRSLSEDDIEQDCDMGRECIESRFGKRI